MTRALRALSTMRALAGSSHPAPTVAVTAMAVLLALAVSLPDGRVALLGAAVLTGQLSIGWSNDRIDAARDSNAGRADKPAAVGRVSLPALSLAAGAALVATTALSLALGWRAGLTALVLVLSGWAYNLGLKATVFSGAAYLVGFAALPAAPFLARTGSPSVPWWAPVVGALLGLGAHIANVLPDLEDDAATGVRGLPHRLGIRWSIALMAASLGGAAVALGIGAAARSSAAGAAIAVVGIAAAGAILALARRRTGAAFRLTLVLALADVVALVALSR